VKASGKVSSETSVDFQRTTWRYIPEGINLHNYRCENLKSYILNLCHRTMWYTKGVYKFAISLLSRAMSTEASEIPVLIAWADVAETCHVQSY
jgi:hypothetical protein